MYRFNFRFGLILLVGIVVFGVSVYFVHGFQMERHADDFKLRAEEAFKEGDVRAGRNLLKQYLQFRKADKETYERMGLAAADLLEGTKLDRLDVAYAIEDMEHTLREHKDLHTVRRRLVKRYLAWNMLPNATQHLEILRTEAGADPQVDFDLARVTLQGGDATKRAEAVGTLCRLVGYDRAKKKFSDKPAPGANIAAAYTQLAHIVTGNDQGLRPEGTAILEQALKLNPKSAEAYLAMAQWQRGRDQQTALANIEQALTLEPKNPDVVLMAAQLLFFQEGGAKRAIKLLRDGLAENRANIYFYALLADFSSTNGDAAGAQNFIDEGLKAIGDELPLLARKALVLLENGRPTSEIRAVLNQLDKLNAHPTNTRPIAAHVDLREGKIVTAARQFEEVRPDLLQASLGNLHYNRLLRLTTNGLVRCYTNMEQPDRLLETYDTMLVQHPGDLDAKVGRIGALDRLGQDVKALEELRALATSKEIGKEKFWTILPLWSTYLQLLLQQELRKPVDKRNWATVDAVLNTVAQKSKFSPDRLTLQRIRIAQQQQNLAVAKVEWNNLKQRIATPAAAIEPQELEFLRREVDMIEVDFLAAESPQKALDRFEELTKNNDTAANRLRKAQLLVMRDGAAAAEQLLALEQDIKEDQQIALWRGLADWQMRLGQIDNFRRLIRQVIDKDPQDLPSRVKLIEVDMQTSDHESLAKSLKGLEQLCGPQSSEWCFYEAVRLQTLAETESTTREKHLAEARKLLKQCQAQRPRWGQPKRAEAMIALAEQQTKDALALLYESLASTPPELRTIGPVVELQMRQGDLAGARKTLALLAERDRNPAVRKIEVQLNMEAVQRKHVEATGMTEEQRKAALKTDLAPIADEARAVMAEIAKNGVPDARDQVWLGDMLAACGVVTEAETAYRAATELAPGSEGTWIKLLQHLVAQGKPLEAGDVVRRIELNLSNDRTPFVLAQCYRVLNKIPLAERLYRDLLVNLPPDGRLSDRALLLRNLVEVNELQRDRDDTDQYLDELLALAPEFAKEKEKTQQQSPQVEWGRRVKAQKLVQEDPSDAQFQIAQKLIHENYVDDNPSADDLVIEARMLAARGRANYVKDAIKLILKLRDRQKAMQPPREMAPEMTELLASLYNQSGQWKACKDEYYFLIGRMGDDQRLKARFVDLLLQHGEPENAKTFLEQLEKVDNRSLAAMIRRVRFEAASGNVSKATTMLMSLVPGLTSGKSGPDEQQIAVLLTIEAELERIKDWDNAEKVVRLVVQNHPKQQLALAALLARRGGPKRTQEAIDICEKDLTASKAEAYNYAPILTIAQYATRHLDTDAATKAQKATMQEWHERAEKADPNSIRYRLLTAQYLDQSSATKEAVAKYENILEDTTLDMRSRAEANNNLAYLLALTGGNLDRALEASNVSIKALGRHSDVLDTRGVVQMQRGELKEAIQDLTEAVEGGATASKYFHLALAHHAAKDLAAAGAALREAVKLGFVKTDAVGEERQWLEKLQLDLKVAPKS